MHSVRLVCFVLGSWLTGGVFMAWIATQNFRGVDRLIEQPHPLAKLEFKTLETDRNFGAGAARLLLRYQVSEQNRFYFESWEIAQLAIGSLLFFFLLFGTAEDKYSLAGVLLMVVLAAAQRFLLTPGLTALGRNLDFTPLADASPERSRFWILHNAYSAIELVKWAIALFLAGRLIAGHRHRKSRGDVRQQLDLIDKADHRHIDG